MPNLVTKGQAIVGSLVVNGTTLTGAEFTAIDGVTAGLVTLSKAVVVDENKDIGDFRNLDAINIDAGSSAVAGSVDVFPVTAANGKLTITATNNGAGDWTTTLTNAAHGQATTVTIPDSALATSYVVQSTAALLVSEADFLDGATTANSVASKTAILDANVKLRNPTNAGAVSANVTAVEYGDGYNHTTVLTLSAVAVTIGDTENLGVGALIYTLPVGAQVIKAADISLAVSASDVANQTDTPEIGLGTVLATTAQATLGAIGTTVEDILEGVAVANCNGTAKVDSDISSPTTAGVLSKTGGTKTIHVNLAGTWANGDVQTATISGTATLHWATLA